MSKTYFSEDEKKKISEAVKDLEGATSGELVPYFVPRSDTYDEASWYLSAMMGAITAASVAIFSYLWLIPFRITPFELSIAIFLLMVVGYLIPILLQSLKRVLVNKQKMLMRVSRRAEEVFLEEEIFNTDDRIGILVFVSQLEHMVVVLGDKGINEKLKSSDWERVVGTIVSGIKSKQLTNGLVEAIGQCKQLLLDNGFDNIPKDKNELSDDIRIGE
ncbi:MAG: hypothetical protein O2887_15305 [Bacteroidetes bacterium]|nr:hypothetical protein [Bacteroidota bacterium]MDA1121830.1 hypothetical protein [Bacteroidota bacterium]